MKQLIPGSIHIDQRNTYIVDDAAVFIYCNGCGRLKMTHPLNETTAFRMIRDSALLCTCAPSQRSITMADRLINRILMDLSNAIGKCETVEDAQRLVWELASKEEMKS